MYVSVTNAGKVESKCLESIEYPTYNVCGTVGVPPVHTKVSDIIQSIPT